MKRNIVRLASVAAVLSTPLAAMAVDNDAQVAIEAAGASVAGLAAAAGAAGVAVMVVIWGIRVASRALKAPR